MARGRLGERQTGLARSLPPADRKGISMIVDLDDDEVALLADLIGSRRQTNVRLLQQMVGTLYPDVVKSQQHRLRLLTAKLFPFGSDLRRQVELHEIG